jgi:hypothetical protein
LSQTATQVRGVDVAKAVVLHAEPPPDSGLDTLSISPNVEDSGLDQEDHIVFVVPALELAGTYRMVAEVCTRTRDAHRQRCKSCES